MTYLEKIITNDGSISFYNKDIGDIYHSKVGAYTEALEKFIKPSNILDRLDNYPHINVLDVCFGLGYNSKVLISEVLKKNPRNNISISAIENDPLIILKSIEIDFAGYQNNIRIFLNDILHKVYYTTVSNRHSKEKFFSSDIDNISLKFFLDDARTVIKSINEQYDLIFHDPFSPNIQPELWTKDIFSKLFNLLSQNGVLLTYSSASSIRSGLIDAGFKLGNTLPIGRKSPGTIAVKNELLISYPLTLQQKEIIDSRSGIPYYDPDLNWERNKIINDRKIKQNTSNRISLSKLKKLHNKIEEEHNNVL